MIRSEIRSDSLKFAEMLILLIKLNIRGFVILRIKRKRFRDFSPNKIVPAASITGLGVITEDYVTSHQPGLLPCPS